MADLFQGSAFNYSLSSWDVSKVTNMSYMFADDTSFNQNIGGWNISALTYAASMFDNVTLSTTNYDALLNGWAYITGGETAILSNVEFDGGDSQYTSAATTARGVLTGTYTWTITDGGLAS
jgi:hypothetical protein